MVFLTSSTLLSSIPIIIIAVTFMIFFLTLFYLLSHSSATTGQAPPVIKDPMLEVELIGSGLKDSPTSMDFIDEDNFLVLQKTGSVYLVSNGTLHPEPVLQLSVDSTLERGLLGIAINKDNKSRGNGYGDDTTEPSNKSKNVDVFLYLTGWDGREALKNRVYKYQWNGTKLINPVMILDLPALPGPRHNSGKLVIGPDNYLYVVIGDLARSGSILQNMKNGSAPDDTGVILRVNPNDGSPAKNNPFLDNGTFNSSNPVAKYYAYGIRNSFGEAFDPITGQLWITENGPLDYDEINVVKPGFNGGWKIFKGPILRTHATYSNLTNLPGSEYSDPVFSWKKPVAVTGMDFASSVLGKKYANNIFVGDFNNGNLYYFVVNANRSGLNFTNKMGLSDLVADNDKEVSYNIFGTGFGNITEVKTGPDGFLYVLDFFNDRILRIVPKE
jgi:aldose sugar dehydrogenase